MVRNLLHTLSSRLVVSLFNLALLFITTKWMGAENKGAISLLVLNLSLTSIFGGLFGGPSLVYLFSRFPLKSLLSINYLWSALSAGLLLLIVDFGLLPSPIVGWELFLLALLESLVAVHTMTLLGAERVSHHNLVQVFKVGLTVGLLGFMQWEYGTVGFESFVFAYRLGLIGALVYSVVRMIGIKGSDQTGKSLRDTVRAALKFGGLVQIGNIAQLLNYRLSFYFLELIINPPSIALIRIGIYSASLQVAEAVWQFARSVSTVQYAKVSNLSDQEKGLKISLSLLKLNVIVTTVGVLFLLVLPQSIYTAIFGSEFGEIRAHVALLSPGIIALSASNALSHFYAGVGLHRINTISSTIGLILTIGLGYPSIYYFGTMGAAGTAGIVYVIQTGYQFVVLKRKHRVVLADLFDLKEEIDLIRGMVGKKLN